MSRRKKSLRMLILVPVLAMVLSACAPATEQVEVTRVVTEVVEGEVVEKEVTVEVEVTAPPEAEEATPEPETEDLNRIVLAEGTAVKTLDVFRSISAPEGHLLEMVFDTLVVIDYDKGEVVPELATSWEVAEDGTTWTFELRDDVTFSDGTRFDAEAAKYSLEKMSDPDFGHVFHDQFAVIQNVEVIDDYTLQFETEMPFAPLLINLAHYTAAMVSPTAYEEYGEDFASNPVGTGPYRLKSWVGDTVVLQKNPDYWGERAWADEIEYVTVPEGGARTADVVAKVPPADVDRLREMEDIRVETSPALFTISLEVNTTKPPLDDPLVRQALMLAIDHDAIAESVLNGLGNNPVSPIGPGIPHRKTFEPWGYDPDEAKELLAQAGYPNGFDIKLWTPSGRYLRDAEVAEAVQGYLGAVGINADFRKWEWSPYLDAVLNEAAPDQEKELFLLGRATMGADFWMYRLWHSESGGNVTGYNNPRVDELLEQGRTTFDSAERDEAYGEVQEIIFKEDLPFIFLYNQNAVYGVQEDVHGVNIIPNEYLILTDMYKE